MPDSQPLPLGDTHTRARAPGAQGGTDGDRVDGVGVAVVVAVVTVLAPIAAGHHEDAPEALAACQHSMLQGGLRSRRVGGQPGERPPPSYQPLSPCLLQREGKEPKGTGHRRERLREGHKVRMQLSAERLLDACTLLI